MRHELLNPENMAPARGFSQVVRPAQGQLVFLAGQTAQLRDGTIGGATMAEQFYLAAANVIRGLEAVGGGSDDVVSLQIFVTDRDEYLASLEEIGSAYRAHFGAHFPAMALLEVSRLFDDAAMVELIATAVVPD